MNGNMRATLHANGHGHVAQTNGRVGGGVNGVGSLPPPSISLAWVSWPVEVRSWGRDYVFSIGLLSLASLLDRKRVSGLGPTS